MSKDKGYYDFDDIDVEEFVKSFGADELFYMRDVAQRKLLLNTEVYQASVSDICRHILQINREDAGIPREERKPILIYICSNGGSVLDGYELIDVIEASTTPVYTIVTGYAYSMGLLAALAGHKRFAFSNSTYLMHDGSNYIIDSGAKAQDQAKFNERLNLRIRDYIISHTAISPEEYDANYRVEWFMFAEEAKEKGLVDAIVTQDADISEVV